MDRFSLGLRSGLWLGRSRTFIVLSLNHFCVVSLFASGRCVSGCKRNPLPHHSSRTDWEFFPQSFVKKAKLYWSWFHLWKQQRGETSQRWTPFITSVCVSVSSTRTYSVLVMHTYLPFSSFSRRFRDTSSQFFLEELKSQFRSIDFILQVGGVTGQVEEE